MYDKIKKIEAGAYPEEMRQLQFCNSWDDLTDYCETKKVKVLLEEDWYLIIGVHKTFIEVVDWASINGCKNPIKAFLFIKEVAGKKAIKLDARESTSYPFIKVLEKRGKLKIDEDDVWYWGEDTMHEMKLRLKT